MAAVAVRICYVAAHTAQVSSCCHRWLSLKRAWRSNVRGSKDRACHTEGQLQRAGFNVAVKASPPTRREPSSQPLSHCCWGLALVGAMA